MQTCLRLHQRRHRQPANSFHYILLPFSFTLFLVYLHVFKQILPFTGVHLYAVPRDYQCLADQLSSCAFCDVIKPNLIIPHFLFFFLFLFLLIIKNCFVKPCSANPCFFHFQFYCQ